MKTRSLWIWALWATVGAGSVARAQTPSESNQCPADDTRQDVHRRLRSLSLDLTGSIPAFEDYAGLEGLDDVPESTIDAMLASPEFAERVIRFHRTLLWPNIGNVQLLDFRTNFRRSGDIYWRTASARIYRGEAVPCRDEPATFDAAGAIEVQTDEQGVRREGWVEVQPYWTPDTTIKVCAFDAQTRDLSPRGNDCRRRPGLFDAGCGCGPNLRRCRFGSTASLADAFTQDLELRIEALVMEGRPYTELFTSRRAFVNGPMVHYLKYQAGLAGGIDNGPLAYDLERLPELAYDDDRFVPIELSPEHAGVLTSYPFLLRFQTNRSRANRYFESFLCQPFSPPPGGLPEVAPNVLPHPDLQQRDGCKYCHALLEPAAAHWGRWTQQGTGFLNPEAFPPTREDCLRCATSGRSCSTECRLHYVTRTLSTEENPFRGQLDAYRFLREDHALNVEMGPKFLVASTIVDDRFPACSARRAMEALFGRALLPEEGEAVTAAGRDFVQSGYDYRALIKAIVTSEAYRRLR